MTGTYDAWLVFLSVVVACVASYSALDLTARVSAAVQRGRAVTWLVAGALVMGTGIWSMHFIGMLAFELPIPMSYDVGTTVLSLVIAVLVSGFALRFAGIGERGPGGIAAAGVAMGLGIVAMHYTGMAAMEMRPPIRYHAGLVALSVAIAVAASAAALWLAFRLRAQSLRASYRLRAGAALVMGAAIAGMHYTGMAAALFAPDSVCTVPPQDIDNVWLAGAIGTFAVALTAIALLTSLYDQRLASRSARFADSLRESEEKYRMLWETTSDAVVILDEHSRIEFANSALKAVFGYEPEEVVGRGIGLLQPEPLREAHLRGMARHLATGEKRLDWRATEAAGLHRDGHEFPIEISFSRSDADGRIRFAGFIRDISERKRFERLLAGQKRVLEAIAGGAPLEQALAAVTRLFEEEFPGTLCTVVLLDAAGRRIARCIGPSLPAAFNAALAGLEIGPEAGSCGSAAFRRELVVSADIATDPKWVPYRALAREHGLASSWSQPIVARDGRVLGTLAMYSRSARGPQPRELDAVRATAPLAGIAIERTLAEEEVRRVTERLQLVAKATNDAVWDWDLVTNAIWWNEGYRTLFGYLPHETKPTAESWSDHIHPDEKERVLWGVHAVIDTGGQSWSDEYRFRRRDGSWADIYDRGFVVRDAAGRAIRMIGAMMDISERKRAEAELARMAQFDALTGLPNRNLFRDRLGQAIARAHREGWVTAVAFVDLDRFKEINDTLGHGAGDEVLKAVGGRLRACLREGDTVARLGGDEFTVILEDVGSLEQAASVARKILAAFELPVAVDGKDLFISGSIGLAAYPEHGSGAEALLQHADTAMYHAKGEGRNALKVYAPTMGAEASERRSVEDGLRLALAREEFVLHYQPIVELAGGGITGVEALLRWQHPDWGLVAPGRFIQVAEQSGLIVPIGAWVLRRACQQAAAWRDAGLPQVTVSVNLSARQFRKADLAEEVAAALQEAGLEPARLKLEITESLLMDNPEASGALLGRLKDMGVTLALDDFGTGYSSLSYLKHFPLDVLKIDQSFVRDLSTDPEDAVIVRAMIGLAHSLQLTLTAEGVETAEQRTFLRSHGCETAQGYFFSRPVPAAQLEALLRQGAPLGAK